MPTTNPVPSTDPSDLLFNAGKLDEVVNGTANSFTDRLGVARRTVAGMNADFDAQLADAESDLNVYRADAAASAAEALGYLQTIRATSYGAYASDPATDPLGNPPTVGDEYFNTTSNLLKRWNGTTWQASDINTANLAAPSGSSLVGYDGGTVQDVLDGAKSLQDYAALRAYTGRAKRIYITGLLGIAKPAGIAGTFQYDPTDATSFDNGGTIIVLADGRRFKRDFTGDIDAGWFGAQSITAPGYSNFDSASAINAAIECAYSLNLGNLITGYDTIRTGGANVTLPPGKFKTDSATINLRDDVKLIGAGRLSTVITSSYNGPIIRNTTITYYDAFGLGLEGITIIGDRTKTNQTGVAILRDWYGSYKDVVVYGCGSHGWVFMQCIHTRLESIEGLQCVGHGIRILDGQISWADATPTNLPSNTMTGNNCHFYGNDLAGICLDRQGVSGSSVNACNFYGWSAEYNYRSSQGGGNTGQNIEIKCSSDVPNEFVNIWVEGGCRSHIYVNAANTATPVRFANLHHFGHGAAGNVDRAIIVDKGQVFVDGSFGHGEQYKTISGSKSPFRLTKATGSMRVTNAQGSTITDNKFVEDENFVSTGLESVLLMNNFGKSYGLFTHKGPNGQPIQSWQKDADAYPFAWVAPGYGIGFGDGVSGNPDAYLQRTAAGVLGVRTGTSFNTGGTWNDSHLIMGGYHLWIDSTGRLRIKFGAPTSAEDGAVAGTQT